MFDISLDSLEFEDTGNKSNFLTCRGVVVAKIEATSNKQQQQAISDFLTLYDNNIVPFSSSDYGK